MFKSKKPENTGRRQRLGDEKLQPKLTNFSYNTGPRTVDSRVERNPKKDFISRKQTARAAHFWSQRIGLLVFLLALVISLVNVLTLSTTAHVIVISNGGNQALLQPASVYQTAADKLLESSAANHSKITVDANGLSKKLMQEFPELASVSVTIPLVAHKPLFYIEPADAVLVLDASNGDYVINSNGKALGLTNQNSSLTSSLPVLTDNSSTAVDVNQDVLPVTDIKFVQTLIAELNAKQYKPSSLTLLAGSDELDVRLTGQSYYIKFNLANDDPAEQAGTFLATVNYMHQQNITPSQYIDVRLAGRAYYQ